MMAMFFLVVCAVGILRPIKNALALDGLGDTDFYKVYLVSAVVILFVPAYNRLSDRFPWRFLIPAVALFFASHLVLFRIFYIEGSATFGLVFYGWYDLFAAALVTQFFMATQLFFNARTARQAYPLVIAGGSIGATLGGAITGFFAEAVGTPNLLLVAAALITLFSIGLPIVWGTEAPAKPAPGRRAEKITREGLRSLVRNREVRLIAGMVFITIIVKQLVDYQFNTITKEVFDTRDAISAFQGKFNAATQWLPLVALAALQPLLRRFGIAVAVLLLPIAMLFTNAGLAIAFGLWAAVAAKGAETSLRYSAERAGRELLYVPVPDEIKLKAKAYIDVAVEKGFGKVASAGVIFLLLAVMPYQRIAWVGLALSVVWLLMAINVRREYVHTLARSIEGRFASLHGVFASLTDATTMPVLRRSLTGDDPLRTAFALDLLGQAASHDVVAVAPDLHALLAHPSAAMRVRALELLETIPRHIDVGTVERRLTDPDDAVREAAVRALHAAGEPDAVLGELLAAPEAAIRIATLRCIARGEVAVDGREAIVLEYADRHIASLDASAEAHGRLETAVAAGALPAHEGLAGRVDALLDDPDPAVASEALRAGALGGREERVPHMIAALGNARLREAARDALVHMGAAVVPALAQALLDESTGARVRRAIPSVLARIPAAGTTAALLRSVIAPETDQVLDYRSIKALSKLRARHPDLAFDRELVMRAADGEVAAAERYARAATALATGNGGRRASALLQRSLHEAWAERREGAFRCLGLLHPPDGMYRCCMALARGGTRARANALEWLEQTVGHGLFTRLAPILEDEPPSIRHGTADPLEAMTSDGDPWIATCAADVLAPPATNGNTGKDLPMDLIEKVFLLQRVDLLRDAKSAHLALLASIADDIEIDAGTVIVREGEPTDALYVLTRGEVELRGVGERLTIEDGQAFGTWALIDQAPSVVEGKATRASRLLRISRDDFHDLVGDYPELAIGLLQGLARRVRTLVA